MQQNKIIIPKEHKKDIRKFLKDASTRITNTNTNFRNGVIWHAYIRGEVICLPKFSEYSNSLKRCINHIVTHEALKNCIHENEVKELIKNSIIEQYQDPKKSDQTKNLIDKLHNIIKKDLLYILPNHVLCFSEGTESIRFSNTIECRRTEDIKNKYANHIPNIQNLNIIVDERYPLPPPDLKLNTVTFDSDSCFCIRIKKCSIGMVDSVARWHIDVVMSLIKLRRYLVSEISIQETYSDIEKEAYTYSTNYDEKSSLIILDNDVETLGAHIKNYYIINSDVQKELDNSNFADICDKICNTDSDTFYDNIQKALGWMTRARTSNDTSTKFLLFFTALEALTEITKKYREKKINDSFINRVKFLVSTIFTNPKNRKLVKKEEDNVTKTIKVIVSTICADPKNRELVEKEIKGLYRIRSRLVHSGCREILINECKKLQEYTEITCGWFLCIIKENYKYDDIGTRIQDAYKNEVKIILERL